MPHTARSAAAGSAAGSVTDRSNREGWLHAEREAKGQAQASIAAALRQRLGRIQAAASIIIITPPPIRSIGNAGGFKIYVQDKRGRGLPALEAATQGLMQAANATPGLTGVFSLFNARMPKVYADIDRVRAGMLGVPPERVFDTLQTYLGSSYINDFSYLGRTHQVTAQADGRFRTGVRDTADLKTRNGAGRMVPIGSVTMWKDVSRAYRVSRYNLFPSAQARASP